jgi:hypothetical protein
MASTIYGAAADLGLGDGDLLSQQVKDSEEERKKKLLRMGMGKPGAYGDNLTGTAASMLLGGGMGMPRG